jgi:RecB family exonuclease
MPGGSPRAARLTAERSFAAFARAAPEIGVSWPARVYDYETEPSPALRSVADLENAEHLALERGGVARGVRRPLVTVSDDAAPPIPGPDLPGGSAALARQAEAPLIAFCEFRLHAKPLEPLDVGLPPPLRGKIVHRALELWARDLPLGAGDTISRAAAERAVEKALQETFAATAASLSSLYELERERLTALLEEFAVREATRAAFRSEALEQRREIAVGRWRIKVRLDRVDRLGAGGVAILDYKTGSRRTAWWNDRLRDVQVPLYVAHADEPVAAAVIVRLAEGAARYEGYWAEGAFPDAPRKLPEGRSFEQQIAAWRAQLVELADGFGAGDTRLYDDELGEARTRYAVLTRVVAALAAERRGADAP